MLLLLFVAIVTLVIIVVVVGVVFVPNIFLTKVLVLAAVIVLISVLVRTGIVVAVVVAVTVEELVLKVVVAVVVVAVVAIVVFVVIIVVSEIGLELDHQNKTRWPSSHFINRWKGIHCRDKSVLDSFDFDGFFTQSRAPRLETDETRLRNGVIWMRIAKHRCGIVQK